MGEGGQEAGEEGEELREAARTGDARVVEELLRRKGGPALIDLQDGDGRTALIEAARYGRGEVARLLLEQHADPNLKDSDGRTALMEAAWRGHAGMAQALLEKG